jgi:hypothetical protein
MALQRTENWEVLLHDFLTERIDKPFEWGMNDCALFTCDCIQALTGTDVATEFRGNYIDEKSAFKIMKKIAGSPTVEAVADYVTKQFEMPEVKPLLAQRGDVVLIEGSEGLALGIVHMDGIHAVFVSPDGLKKLPVRQALRAWRV